METSLKPLSEAESARHHRRPDVEGMETKAGTGTPLAGRRVITAAPM